MKLYLEQETNADLPFDPLKTARAVADETLRVLSCPYDAQVNVLLTDADTIRQINRENRQIDAVTDVLSFPMIFWDTPCQWDEDALDAQGAFYPGTNELILGDIVICMERVEEQARLYGHSRIREYSFLIAHSMLHLCGFDHMTQSQAEEMERLQNEILDHLGITRDMDERPQNGI